MNKPTTDSSQDSPFHAGELQIQARTGSLESVAAFARQAIRNFMPDQHRAFFQQLPFLVVGSVDQNGSPWASIVPGKPGFIQSDTPTTLEIAASPLFGDPLSENLLPGKPLGLLGIDITTRRRNRVNVTVASKSTEGFSAQVDQSFGNCPQYIQKRSVDFVRDAGKSGSNDQMTRLQSLDTAARDLITAADTFFVASYAIPRDQPTTEGVDVSHRGGQPGFVKVEGDTLTIPDYPGNYLFNTLGNFTVNPKAGLIFTDFNTGDVLQLTGSVEILWEHDPVVQAFQGAERAWRFKLDHAIRISNALPFRSILEEFSANTLLTGSWQQAEMALAAEAQRDAWRPFAVTRIQDESEVIRSFYLEPTDGHGLPSFEAGQHLTLRAQIQTSSAAVIRNYTVSSAPGESYYRISVKREPDGVMSNHLHQSLKTGDIIEIRAPRGDFFLDPAEHRPAVLLAAGVGITPMMAMAQHVANQGVLTRHTRELTILHASQSIEQRAFADQLSQLELYSGGKLRYLSYISGSDGRINTEVLKSRLALDDYDFMLCGPAAFIQAMYDSLQELGVSDSRIYAEAFGPSSLTRRPEPGVIIEQQLDEADDALVHFTVSDVEQRWNKGDATLLELAEMHGLTPAYGCRSGSCGSCAATLVSGNVTYRTTPSAQRDPDQVLICCAVPAKDSATLKIAL
ncbi:pyridoxamine 5'-phosphate oxidase family protein [Granulosicoccus antarcticus]|uniref:Flavohemoprotein n=1 Tax=Granulosicoccus antarcticus IMCC3135 TaxID=1192854 RepID=A0A2Z2NRW2_9GAMM|nr:pyridoxamine 5'-phosphate oxidase family protein [Granulosicoccus antarcticus]ASJ74113.1 Flavohemoprotein [Granulosicoccus antarcticus IMCC3135]